MNITMMILEKTQQNVHLDNINVKVLIHIVVLLVFGNIRKIVQLKAVIHLQGSATPQNALRDNINVKELLLTIVPMDFGNIQQTVRKQAVILQQVSAMQLNVKMENKNVLTELFINVLVPNGVLSDSVSMGVWGMVPHNVLFANWVSKDVMGL